MVKLKPGGLYKIIADDLRFMELQLLEVPKKGSLLLFVENEDLSGLILPKFLWKSQIITALKPSSSIFYWVSEVSSD